MVAGIGRCRCQAKAPGDEAELHGFVLEDVSGSYSPGTWGAVAVKRAEAWAWYLPRYLDEMRESYRRDPAAWRDFLAHAARMGRITLCCYCATAEQCHRTVLAGLLVAVAQRRGWNVVYMGEREAA